MYSRTFFFHIFVVFHCSRVPVMAMQKNLPEYWLRVAKALSV